MGRAPCCDKANVKRGPWSPEEDAKLKSHIEKHGTGGNWIALPQKIGLRRCGKSCRLRWLNYLRPNIKHGGFTEDEDNLICNLYISIGSRWSIIAAQLPGRTDNDIKNYWNTRLKKKLMGRQRREQEARRDLNFANKQLEGTKKGFCYENYSSNMFFGTYPNPPQISEGYKCQESQNCYMPSFEAMHAYNNDRVERKYENFESFRSIPDVRIDQNQDIYKNSMCMSGNNFQDFDEIPEEIIYYTMPQVDSFSGLDLVNSSTTTTTVSQELGTVWGDMNSLIYPPVIPVEELCQPKMAQEWTYFEEPRLPGY